MRLGWRVYRFLCQIAFTAYLGLRTRHRERVPLTGGCLLACNHQSFLDPIIALVFLRREACFMARDSLFRNRWFRGLIRYLNAFPVKRGTADLTAIKEALRRLKAGQALVAFPEGTRTPDGRIQPLIGGALLIARKARVPIIPTLILGAFEAWPRSSRWPRPRRLLIAYGEPLTPESLVGLDDEQVTQRLHERLVHMLHEYRRDPWIARSLAPLPPEDAPFVYAGGEAAESGPAES